MAKGTNRMSWIGRDMAVDLGTANTLVWQFAHLKMV